MRALISLDPVLWLLAACAQAAVPAPVRAVGHTFEIVQRYETSQTREGGSGSARGGSALVERVIAVRDGGVELEFDLPAETPAAVRAQTWQFPARVFRAGDGGLQLLDRAALDARVDAWLEAGGLTRAACGTWVFTWNAFLIECDPESVLATIGAIDLGGVDLREGAPYRDPEALGTAPLAKTSDGPDGATYAVELPIDAEAARRGLAESDVAVGQMTGAPITLEDALRRRAKLGIDGTVTVSFEVDASGNTRKRTRVTRITIAEPGGAREDRAMTETVERRPARGDGPGP